MKLLLIVCLLTAIGVSRIISFTSEPPTLRPIQCRNGQIWNGIFCVPANTSSSSCPPGYSWDGQNCMIRNPSGGGDSGRAQRVTSKWRFTNQNFVIDVEIGATISQSSSCRKRYCYSGKIESISANRQSISIDSGAYFTLEGDSTNDYRVLVPKDVDDQTKGALQAFGQILLDNASGDQSFSTKFSGKGTFSSDFVKQGSGYLDLQAVRSAVSAQFTQADVPTQFQPKLKNQIKFPPPKLRTRSTNKKPKKSPPPEPTQKEKLDFQAYANQLRQQQGPPSNSPKRLLQWFSWYQQCHQDLYTVYPLTVRSHTYCQLVWFLNFKCLLSVEVVGFPQVVYFDKQWFYLPGPWIVFWTTSSSQTTTLQPGLDLTYTYSGYSAYISSIFSHEFYLSIQLSIVSAPLRVQFGFLPVFGCIFYLVGELMNAEITNTFLHHLFIHPPSTSETDADINPTSYIVYWQLCFMGNCVPTFPGPPYNTTINPPIPIPNPKILCQI